MDGCSLSLALPANSATRFTIYLPLFHNRSPPPLPNAHTLTKPSIFSGTDLASSVGGPLLFCVCMIALCLRVREIVRVWVLWGRRVRARGQCESANEEKQHGCQGLPGAGQTQSLGADVSEGKGAKVNFKGKSRPWPLRKVGVEESKV